MAAPPPTSQLWLVRHGETEWSASGRHTGTTDIDLTERGVRAATGLARRLDGRSFAQVWSSPLLRARRTAALAGFAEPTVVDDLAEWRYGEDEGITTEEIRRTRPGWSVWTEGPRGGETAEQVQVRADAVVERARAVDGAVVAFCHGHVARVIGARWIGLAAAEGARLTLGTGAVSVLGWYRETPALVTWNDTGELPAT